MRKEWRGEGRKREEGQTEKEKGNIVSTIGVGTTVYESLGCVFMPLQSCVMEGSLLVLKNC
jgi:hypothetical protein